MRQALDMIAGTLSSGRDDAQTCAWAGLRYQDTQAVRAALLERLAPATVNKLLARSAWCLEGGLAARPDDRGGPTGARRTSRACGAHTLPRGRALSAGELRVLFEVCAEDQGLAGRRDAALLAVLYGGGLRRSEAVALDLVDYTPGTGELRIRRGKGRKDRLVYATNGASQALEAWLGVRGHEAGPLFAPVNKGGRIQARRLTDQAVRKILRKRALEAASRRSAPTTCDGCSSATCSMLALTSRRCSILLATQTSRPRLGTIAAARSPSTAQPACSTCRTRLRPRTRRGREMSRRSAGHSSPGLTEAPSEVVQSTRSEWGACCACSIRRTYYAFRRILLPSRRASRRRALGLAS